MPRRTLTLVVLGSAALTAAQTGCVRRTLTIETEPRGAILTLNDEEIGSTPVSRDFTWYGDYDVVIRKPGFQTLQTNIVIKPPWYEVLPFDVFADVFWPGELHDQHRHAFTLEPWVAPEPEEVVVRALELREEALADDD